MRSRANTLENETALAVLGRIDAERMIEDLESALDAARSDPDAADKCQQRLLDLRSAVDEVEFALEQPALVEQVQEELAELRAIVDEVGTTRDKQRADILEREAREVIDQGETEPMWRKYKEVYRYVCELWWEKPSSLIRIHNFLEENRASMIDAGLADRLFTRAKRALDDRDNPALRAALNQLVGLLPPEKRGRLKGYGGTTIN